VRIKEQVSAVLGVALVHDRLEPSLCHWNQLQLGALLLGLAIVLPGLTSHFHLVACYIQCVFLYIPELFAQGPRPGKIQMQL
jgi:hypothetical protein